jgi:tetratricopeptide (TPR) repeat protein
MPQIEELSDSEALINSYKEEGNQFIKSGDHLNAVKLYLKALDLVNESDANKQMNAKKCESDRLVLYKNLSLAYLKLKDFNNAIVYATKALELSPNDVKALFRRCQAFDAKQLLE